jgi:hypothetical protein
MSRAKKTGTAIRRSIAFREFAAKQRSRAFERAMSEMAADPQVRNECDVIERQFAKFEVDGLGGDPTQ